MAYGTYSSIFNYGRGTSTVARTSQQFPIPGRGEMVRNNAGGFGFKVTDQMRLERFLAGGTEGGTYYVEGKELTLDNVQATLRLIQQGGETATQVIDTVVDWSVNGRMIRNEPALFVLALAQVFGDAATRDHATAQLPRVARIGTDILHWSGYTRTLRKAAGRGPVSRNWRTSVQRWFDAYEPRDLAYQAIKYPSRDDWALRDLLRLAHVKPKSETHATLYHYIVNGWEGVGAEPHDNELLRQVWAVERLKGETDEAQVIRLIRDHRVPREAIPSQWLKSAAVWEALLQDMPTTALLRNLANLTRVGLLAPLSEASKKVVAQLTDAERVKRARVHPIAALVALKVYGAGGKVGKSKGAPYDPVTEVIDALDALFYARFEHVTPTGKRRGIYLDISGSMQSPVSGAELLSCRAASSALALIAKATEKGDVYIGAFHDRIEPVTISPRMRLDDVLNATDGWSGGGTDCALPMLDALDKGLQLDSIEIFTDNQTWFGEIHPAQALWHYRQQTGIATTLVVHSMTASEFSIADPEDGGMKDVVGFDTNAPQLVADFIRGAGAAEPALAAPGQPAEGVTVRLG